MDMFGPRDSLDLEALERPALFFRDETSFDLAHALRFTARGAEGFRMVFEVGSKAVAERVLGHLGIADAELIEHKPNDSYRGEVEEVVADHLQTPSIKGCALSGKARRASSTRRRRRGGHAHQRKAGACKSTATATRGTYN